MQAYQGITVIARSVLETTSAQPQAGSGLGHGRNLGVQLLPQDVCDSDLCALDEIPDHHVPIRDEVQVLAIPHSIFFDTEFHHEIHAPGAQACILHMITVVDALWYINVGGSHAHVRAYAHSAPRTLGHITQIYPEAELDMIPALMCLLLEHVEEIIELESKSKTRTKWTGSRRWLLGFGPGIGYGVVGLLYLLETRSVSAAIRMVLRGQASIGALDIFCAGTTINTQGLIWISHTACLSLFCSRLRFVVLLITYDDGALGSYEVAQFGHGHSEIFVAIRSNGKQHSIIATFAHSREHFVHVARGDQSPGHGCETHRRRQLQGQGLARYFLGLYRDRLYTGTAH